MTRKRRLITIIKNLLIDHTKDIDISDCYQENLLITYKGRDYFLDISDISKYTS